MLVLCYSGQLLHQVNQTVLYDMMGIIMKKELLLHYTVVLDAVGPDQLGILTYNSSLNVTLEKNVTVKCANGLGQTETAIPTIASK